MKIEILLSYLKCPSCGNQKITGTPKSLFCPKCKKRYRVIEGVPVMVEERRFNFQELSQKNWFEKHYSKFSSERYEPERWRLSMLGRIFGFVSNQKVNNYLDIGCGATGYTVIEGAKRNGWRSFGVDISLEAMIRAKKLSEKGKVEENTAFLVCSAENLPFRQNVFDYVSAVSLLEHIKNDEKVIKTVSEILKINKHFYVCVPNTYKRMYFFLRPIYFYLDKKIGHQRHYSLEELREKMSKNGFILKDYFYNAHLKKLVQIILEKMKLIDDKSWWKIENRDLSKNCWGIQLNAWFQKSKL